MKWAVTVLISLGVLAALSATILVSVLRADPSGSAKGNSSSSVEVVLAKTSLPAMSVITSVHVVGDAVSKNGLPKEHLSSPVQAVGRILAVPVVEGQVLTESCFVTEGSGAQLAAALPHGMRAVSITLSGRAVSGGLLYPGCVVDVLASFRLPSADRNRGQAISTTLLHGIQVLAVEDVTIVTKRDDKKKSTLKGSRTSSGHVTIALMVAPRQAEALQLARDYGKISLAMRNPLDSYPVDVDATVLSEGRLAKLGSLMTPVVAAAQQQGDAEDSSEATEEDKMRLLAAAGISTYGQKEATRRAERVEAVFTTGEDRARTSLQWGVTVIRGRDVVEQELDISKSKAASWADAE